jgi:branched-chain amino acid transport system substrate-binding protein
VARDRLQRFTKLVTGCAVVATLCIQFMVAPSAQAAAKLVPYVIGLSTQASGSSVTGAAITADETGDSLKAWIDWTNAHGGVNGHQVKLVEMDNQGDCGKDVADVHTLVQSDHVLALVGEVDSGCESNYAAYLQQQGVADLSATPLTFVYNTNPVFFPVASTIDVYLYSFVDAAKVNGAKSFAWMTCVETAACQLGTPVAQATAKSLGLPFFSRAFSTASPTFTAECLAAEQFGNQYGKQKQQAVFVALANPRFADQCGQQGYKPLYIQDLAGDYNQAGMLPIVNDPNLNGEATPEPEFPWFVKAPATADFRAAMAKYLPKSIRNIYGPTAAGEWMSGLAFAAGAAKLGNNPTPAKFIKGMYSIHNKSLGGLTPPLNYVQGQPKDIRCFYVIRVEDGKGTAPYKGLVAPNGLKTTCDPTPKAAPTSTTTS